MFRNGGEKQKKLSLYLYENHSVTSRKQQIAAREKQQTAQHLTERLPWPVGRTRDVSGRCKRTAVAGGSVCEEAFELFGAIAMECNQYLLYRRLHRLCPLFPRRNDE